MDIEPIINIITKIYHVTFQRNGTFSLEVIEELPKAAERKVFYKIRTTFALDNPDTVTTNEYDVMFAGGSLWYVANAPSFDRLDQGDTILMMASPIACGGEMNLKIFELSEYRDTRLFRTGQGGDFCDYQGHVDPIPRHFGYYISPIDVLTIKFKGVVNFRLSMLTGGSLAINPDYIDERFELIGFVSSSVPRN